MKHRTFRALVAAVALLAFHNVFVNRIAPDAVFVPLNLAMTALLLWIARGAGLGWGDVGLARADLRRGLRLGATFAVIATAGILLGALLPATRGFFEDARVERLSGLGVAYHAFVRIPFGTVVLEEVAFRGVLLALLLGLLRQLFLRRRGATVLAVTISSALFGLWHIVPTLTALDLNDLADGTIERVGAVTGAVITTALGGAFFCWMRLRSGSVLAPSVLHVTTNSVATVTAFVVISL